MSFLPKIANKFGVFLVDVDFGAGGGVDTEIGEYDELIVGNHVSGMEFGILEFVETFKSFLDEWISSGTN